MNELGNQKISHVTAEALDDVSRLLDGLRAEASALAKSLARTASDLSESGVIPDDDVASGVNGIRERFREATAKLRVLLETAPDPPGTLPPIQSIRDLESLVDSLANQLAESVDARSSEAARDVVERALLLRAIRDGDPPLNDVIVRVSRVSRDLVANSDTELARALAEGRHEVAALVILVDSSDAMSNQAWDAARESVAAAFSPEIATAAARGKLEIRDDEVGTASPEPEPAIAMKDPRHEAAAAASRVGEASSADQGDTPHSMAQKLAATTSPSGEPTIAVDTAMTAAELAETALSLGRAERGPLLAALSFKLLADGNPVLARAMSLAAGSLDDVAQQLPPAPLLTALVLSTRVRESAGATASIIEQSLSELEGSLDLTAAPGVDASVRVLMAASALHASILAPSSGAPSTLRATRVSDAGLSQLGALCDAVAHFGDQGNPLDPNCIKDVTAQVDWDQRLEEVRSDAENWRKTARLYTIVYAPATQVWQRWLEPGGRLSGLLEPVVANDASRVEWVREQCVELRKESEIDRAVQRTFSSLKSRKRGLRIEAKALRRIVSHVSEAVELARRWLALLESRPGESRDYIRRQAHALRQEVLERAPTAIGELEEWASAAEDVDRAAAAVCVKKALVSLAALFEPSTDFSFFEPNPRFLLNGDLLRVGQLYLDDDGGVPSSWDAVEAILVALNEGLPSFAGAFEHKVNHGDLNGSYAIIELLEDDGSEEVDIDALRDRQVQAERDSAKAFERDLDATRSDVEQSLSSGFLGETERNDLSAQIETARSRLAEGREFRLAHAELAEVREKVASAGKRSLIATNNRLAALGLPEGDEARARIEDALARSDAWTAHEYLDRVEQGGSLPAESRTQSSFDDFWPNRAIEINRAMQEPRGKDGAKGVKALRAAIGQKANFGGLNFDFEANETDRARGLVKAWQEVSKSKELVSPIPLRELLHELGFEGVKVANTDNSKRSKWVEIEVESISDRRLIPVAHYGSQAHGRYLILCVWGEPSEEDLVRQVGDTTLHEAPVIVLYFGRLGEDKRRALLRLCLDMHRTFVVVDEVLLMFLAAETGVRLSTLFACALPFTWLEPYATTAGLVPPEMFFGRQSEREEVQSSEGSCFMYGGRQLGKTALLKDVERTFDDPDSGRVARYIDLKREGLGYDRPAGDIWGVIVRELQSANVLPGIFRAGARPAKVREAIASWLSSTPGRRILLLLDEADEFLASDGKQGWRCSTELKGLMDETTRGFKVVFAGLHNVQRSVRSANHPLAHYGTAICIGPLIERGEWSDARSLVQGPINVMGFDFESQDLVTKILSQTNYFPSLLQLYGQQLLRKVADPNSPVFDDRTSPPSIVTQSVVDEAYQGTRESIRQRFQWTLQLDPRYEVLAYGLALESLADPEGATSGYPVTWFRDEALLWWSSGFSGERGSYDSIHALLDEMVGLGVLRVGERGKFAFRSPNVVSLLGTQSEVEEQLERHREPPVEYAPSHFRRPDPDDSTHRSPLTVEQEEELRFGRVGARGNQVRLARNGVSVAFGWTLAGLSDLPRFLEEPFGDSAFCHIGEEIGLAAFQKRLPEIWEKSGDGTALVFVSNEANWSISWVKFAAKFCKARRSETRFLRVLFGCDPKQTWTFLDHADIESSGIEIGDTVDVLTLRRFSMDATRQWLEDAQIPLAPEQHTSICDASGAWPVCLYQLPDLIALSDPGSVIGKLNRKAIDLAKSSLVLADGNDAKVQYGVLKALADWGEPVGEEDLEVVLDDHRQGDAKRVIRWLEALGLVESDADGAWKLDPIVSGAIATGG